MSSSSGFYVHLTGQIDSARIPGSDNLYVKYSFSYGPEWSALSGLEHGVSQISQQSHGQLGDVLVWNYPLDVTFRSSNVFGWPQLVIGVYGVSNMGQDIIQGYASVHLPLQSGRFTRYLPLFTPLSSSIWQRISAFLTNSPPEFFDSKFVAQGKGREVTRVKSNGSIKVTFNVITKHLSEFGYDTTGERNFTVENSLEQEKIKEEKNREMMRYNERMMANQQPIMTERSLSARPSGSSAAEINPLGQAFAQRLSETSRPMEKEKPQQPTISRELEENNQIKEEQVSKLKKRGSEDKKKEKPFTIAGDDSEESLEV